MDCTYRELIFSGVIILMFADGLVSEWLSLFSSVLVVALDVVVAVFRWPLAGRPQRS